jgi:hypothetical protein
LRREGVEGIAIAVKARPDSIHRNAIGVLDELGLFRVFLGVENASEHGLRDLNRKCAIDQIRNALSILNEFDIHVAYNILLFEPDATMDDILVNLRFMERNVENPFNFCRAEAYAGTGLERTLRAEGRLLGDYFGFDYRLKDPCCEAFHQIANYAFFDRNFNDNGLHYFNMQVDFYFQLLRRFHPQVLTQTLRGAVRSFIKRTNLDTHQRLCEIYDWVTACDPSDQVKIRGFAREMKGRVTAAGEELRDEGERILAAMTASYEHHAHGTHASQAVESPVTLPMFGGRPVPYTGLKSLGEVEYTGFDLAGSVSEILGVLSSPVPYGEFKRALEPDEQGRTGG